MQIIMGCVVAGLVAWGMTAVFGVVGFIVALVASGIVVLINGSDGPESKISPSQPTNVNET